MQAETPDSILRIKTVLEHTGLGRSPLYRKMHNGTFPKNVQISTRCAGWRESVIAEWLKNPMFYEVRKD
jgi:prophage regulatory protein